MSKVNADGAISAAAAPWAARIPSSIAPVEENPASTETTVKAATPPRNTGRAPNRSVSRPPARVSTAKGTV
ncbi:hypothetical protein Mspyr1_54720 (plasmid) [Mycolicibacterium gilvum Spyr1]|uniref:Uncharacterized protein n=1 Tax=Mycolicibacterium gilvum (strain DSM 45189 / LMG 24558 / Spyr1) TaxID=278137 RepID=E6TQ60_MYCSR|nr:hypothetical protein Mspyr1_54720 [Mycolicibacterium gilvum Spyr1]